MTDLNHEGTWIWTHSNQVKNIALKCKEMKTITSVPFFFCPISIFLLTRQWRKLSGAREVLKVPLGTTWTVLTLLFRKTTIKLCGRTSLVGEFYTSVVTFFKFFIFEETKT